MPPAHGRVQCLKYSGLMNRQGCSGMFCDTNPKPMPLANSLQIVLPIILKLCASTIRALINRKGMRHVILLHYSGVRDCMGILFLVIPTPTPQTLNRYTPTSLTKPLNPEPQNPKPLNPVIYPQSTVLGANRVLGYFCRL